MLYPVDRGSMYGALQGFGGTGEEIYLFQENEGNKDLQMKGTLEQRKFWGTGNIGNDDFDLGTGGQSDLFQGRNGTGTPGVPHACLN